MALPVGFVCSCRKCSCVIGKYFPAKVSTYKRGCARKAGAFICADKYMLLVQSCGRFWGPPKGTVEANESIRDCAIREVLEETGLDVSGVLPQTYTKLKSRFYYYLVYTKQLRAIPSQCPGNDVNGIGWFNIDCVRQNIENGTFLANQHLRYGLDIFFKIKNETES